MPITDENDPRMQHAELALRESVARLMEHHNEITTQFIFHLQVLINEHRSKARRILGIDYPSLVPVFVPRLKILELGRADLDEQQYQIEVDNFINFHAHQGLDQQEAWDAAKRAWPQFDPTGVIDRATHIARERARRAYIDENQPERECGHCHRTYRGPSRYCSLECEESHGK